MISNTNVHMSGKSLKEIRVKIYKFIELFHHQHFISPTRVENVFAELLKIWVEMTKHLRAPYQKIWGKEVT